MSWYTVRPSNSNSEKEVFRVKLTATSLLFLKIKPGDLVLLKLTTDTENAPPRPVIAWEHSSGGMKDNIVQTSKTLQELYGFKLGDKIGIVRSTEKLTDASKVTVKPVSFELASERESLWQGFLSAVVPTKYDVLGPGLQLTIQVGNETGNFEMMDVGGLLGRVTAKTQFVICPTNQDHANASKGAQLELSLSNVGGLQHEIDKIKQQVELLLNINLAKSWSGFRPSNGILLYGSKGTGKTLLTEELAKCAWGSIVRWSNDATLPIPPVYPRLIIVNSDDLLAAQKALLDMFRSIRGSQTVVVGEAKHPNDVKERLRTTDTFEMELELPVPDSDKRLDILKALRREAAQPTDQQLSNMAQRTHGFVGADLNSLLHKIWMSADSRARSARPHTGCASSTNGVDKNSADDSEIQLDHNPDGIVSSKGQLATAIASPSSTSALPITITQDDIEQSLPQVRPSALQQVFLEKPNVRWSDIGGQHALKTRLTTAVERTLSPSIRQRMTRLGVEVTKGILLYGPPGCSKTLLAKAVANEAELNFLAVKGAELISMYVGESERATREVFRKARAAAPSILFFDEIDAIASRSSSSNQQLNVLTTLLNEMDGFEELKNVIVIAATNKPQQIDPALLRPGRFDNVVYVGLPDVETRREIFENRFRNVDVTDDVRSRMQELAEKTGGHSGAEVVAICKAAGELVLDAGRDWIEFTDVENAISGAARGVTREVLQEYERWNEAQKRGS